MRTKLLYLLLFLSAACTLRAQVPAAPELRERIYVQTDKQMYLAGELVWLKLITTTDQGIPLDFSKVGYVELVDADASKAQVKLELRDGTGNGTLLLPTSLPTGAYRLIAYTRYMRNESPEVFFEKTIGIVNPLSPQVYTTSDTDRDLFPAKNDAVPTAGAGIRLSSGQSDYAPRTQVELTLSQLPENLHTLSVSVTGADYTSSFATPQLAAWQQSVSSLAKPAVGSGYLPEYEGHIVLGSLRYASTGQVAASKQVAPLLSFPGNEIHVFVGEADKDGNVLFHTQRVTGYSEVLTTLNGANADQYKVEIMSPFVESHVPKTLPTLNLSALDREKLERQSIGMQVQYSYANDQLNRFAYQPGQFFWQPDNQYIMQEYTKFGTMQEVIAEFVAFVHFRRVNQKRQLVIIKEGHGFLNMKPLVLLDGIPVFDHELLFNYNPLLLERIDVYLDQFIFGGQRFEGIVAFYTEENKYPEFLPDPFTHFFPYDSPQSKRVFYAPQYPDADSRESRLPDYRHTLYWDANVQTQGAENLTIPFYTSDIPGEYQVLVEGITKDGEVVHATLPLKVQ